MKMEEKLRDLIKGKACLGQMVTTTGVIFTLWNDNRNEEEEVFDHHFVAPSFELWQDKRSCVFIGRSGLENEIRVAGVRSKAGGVNGGGLSHECSITGRFVKSTVEEFQYEFVDLKSLSIMFKGKFRDISLS